jgi:hypothetical protein
MVSTGPMKLQRSARPSFMVKSRSSAETWPEAISRKASFSTACCSRFRIKPSISRLTVTGAMPQAA